MGNENDEPESVHFTKTDFEHFRMGMEAEFNLKKAIEYISQVAIALNSASALCNLIGNHERERAIDGIVKNEDDSITAISEILRIAGMDKTQNEGEQS